MTVSVIIPTIPGRERMLERACESLHDAFAPDVEIVTIPNSPSCGEGWTAGVEASSGEILLLAADDVEAQPVYDPEPTILLVRFGKVVAPVVYNPDGSLQGAGGFGLDVEDGQVGVNAAFPMLSRATWDELQPIPPLNHYCDVWISSWAGGRGRGPVVSYGVRLTHHVVSRDRPGERERYAEWLEWRESTN